MSIIRGLLVKLGLASFNVERASINVFVLDDDTRRHRWFEKRFKGDFIDLAENVEEAKTFLSQNSYDAVFLDHDLLPEHYQGEVDDEKTGFAIALWLNENRQINRAATVIVHTRNADAAIRMVETLRESGRTVEYVPFPMLDARIKTYWKK